jgi:hypothetical protein
MYIAVLTFLYEVVLVMFVNCNRAVGGYRVGDEDLISSMAR